MGYQVKWEESYLVVEKDGVPLATVDRWEENAYSILKVGKRFITDEVMMMILSLASTSLEEREPKMAWEMVK